VAPAKEFRPEGAETGLTSSYEDDTTELLRVLVRSILRPFVPRFGGELLKPHSIRPASGSSRGGSFSFAIKEINPLCVVS
jgi:hypothetical protein